MQKVIKYVDGKLSVELKEDGKIAIKFTDWDSPTIFDSFSALHDAFEKLEAMANEATRPIFTVSDEGSTVKG